MSSPINSTKHLKKELVLILLKLSPKNRRKRKTSNYVLKDYHFLDNKGNPNETNTLPKKRKLREQDAKILNRVLASCIQQCTARIIHGD